MADWFYTTTMVQRPGLAGPEIDVPDTLWMTDKDTPQSLRFKNGGAFVLEVSLTEPGSGWQISPNSLSIAPGTSATVTVTPPANVPLQDTALVWTSNDPDETTGQVHLRSNGRTIGQPHEDFSLEGFVWPDTSPRYFQLAQESGKVVFLAYFATS